MPVEKIERYLLAQDHPEGGSKARLLRQMGFEIRDFDVLVDQLLSIADGQDVVDIATTVYGTKYVVDGIIEGPVGADVLFRTVWVISFRDERPRFVTAYPIGGPQRRLNAP